MIKEKKCKPGDLIILVLCIVIVMVILFINHFRLTGDQVLIEANGKTNSYPLYCNQEIILNNKKNNGENKVIIHNGQVYVASANCKNQICVNHKPISKEHETIICIPNQVFIEIADGQENEIDN